MNYNTKQAFLKFINDVEVLAQGVVPMTGIRDTETLLENAEHLKKCLNSDETIPD